MRGILVPTKFEAAEFLRVLRNPIKYSIDGVRCYLGELNDATVTVGIIGMGPPHAAQNTEYFIRKVGPSEIIMAGFTGAINPRLARGAVIKDPILGRIHPVDSIVATPKEKETLYNNTRLDIVDMETKQVTEKAEAYSLTCIAIRVVSDRFDESVPVELLRKGYNQAKGKTTPIKMGLYLMTHPKKIKELKAFLEPLKPLRVTLCEAVIEYIETTIEPRPIVKDRTDRNIFPPEPVPYKWY